MPNLLKKDAIRLLQGSRDSLFLAVCGLGIPRTASAAYSRCAEIGLIGAAAEMAMSACIIQCYGPDFVREPSSGRFKSAQKILDDFKDMLKNPLPASNFLFAGIESSQKHRDELLSYVEKFGCLATVRAGGLHAGMGVTKEVAGLKAREVSEFLRLLGKSTRINPYVEHVPSVAEKNVTSVVLLDELVNRINSVKDAQEKACLIGSLFLVLPSVPKETPDWVNAFNQISLAPKARDVTLLLETISTAEPGVLKRLSRSGGTIPVRVDQNDPNAYSIAPHMLRRSIEKPYEQWHADVSMANGRLAQGILHLPPTDFVLYLFDGGVEVDGIQSNKEPLPHIETWPFIAASLHAQGIQRPHWFLVRKTDNLDELAAHVKKASALSTHLAKNFPLLKEGIEALKKGVELKIQSEMSKVLTRLVKQREMAMSSVRQTISNQRNKLSSELADALNSWEEEESSLSGVLTRLLDDEFSEDNKQSWITKLCQCGQDIEDITVLISILQTPEAQAAHTYARRSLSLIDLHRYGPPCAIDWSQITN